MDSKNLPKNKMNKRARRRLRARLQVEEIGGGDNFDGSEEGLAQDELEDGLDGDGELRKVGRVFNSDGTACTPSPATAAWELQGMRNLFREIVHTRCAAEGGAAERGIDADTINAFCDAQMLGLTSQQIFQAALDLPWLQGVERAIARLERGGGGG